jgi:hypothetical protein
MKTTILPMNTGIICVLYLTQTLLRCTFQGQLENKNLAPKVDDKVRLIVVNSWATPIH